ncbi:FliM/FliN family flagellar motor switch protein [Herbaspirillum sp. YR522]|uniref:FliM/FliN family flagellar motor switch protein n=1 Tax=Herbaspirillum sp. YR522 TaxID=1144342 RepID=UPI00026FC503|nr:FliM/FliN family flagellar motor switch protein [Herbaspirillum sp. YR522]EJN02574.1 flagellar motor switch/type III secretory pathway protein [Herbaspirillum sp. YR522]
MTPYDASTPVPGLGGQHAAAWPDLPLLPPAQAETRNQLVRWCALAPRHVRLLDDNLVVGASPARARYPITLHLRSADGTLQLGCDLQPLLPEMACDVLPPLAADDGPEHRRATWMLAPWIDCLTQQLGQQLHLERITHDAPWEPGHWAMQVWRSGAPGQSGTLGVTGSLLPRLAAALPARASRYTHLAHIPITLHWRIRAPALSHAQLQALDLKSVILLQYPEAELCLSGRHGTIRLRGTTEQGDFLMNDIHLASDDMLASPHPPGGMIPLDMLMASVDVVLDSIVMPLSEIAALAPGSALPLSQFDSGRAVTLRCNGVPFARGEVVVIGERLGVVLTHTAGVQPNLPEASA